jgi:hypothetical protein
MITQLPKKDSFTYEEVVAIVEKVEKICHAAGWFDGEGCIKSRLNPSGGIALAASISNTYYRGLTNYQEMFGGGICTWKVPEGHKPIWQWQVTGDGLVKFLDTITPYLDDKQSQAEYAVGVLKHQSSRKRKRLTPQDKETYKRYNEELRAMKQDLSRLGRNPAPHGFDEPELTISAQGDELRGTLSDKNSGLMLTWNTGL